LVTIGPGLTALTRIWRVDSSFASTRVSVRSAPLVEPYLRRHHMQAGVGHYGVFSGKR
jgi:hypothetical protein